MTTGNSENPAALPAQGEDKQPPLHAGEPCSPALLEEAFFWLAPPEGEWWACPWCGNRDNAGWVVGCPGCGYRKYNPWGYLLRPVETTVITAGFSPTHRALDFGAPEGSPVFAAGDGVVVEAGRDRWAGNVVRIQHEGGLQTRYGHLRDSVVSSGLRVRMGQVIAHSGSTGVSTGPHLHFEVIDRAAQVDPLTHLGPLEPLPSSPKP
ncbi:MAG TPA: M23 family metallopeptidase [Deltaproteobacteria bacterium]|nr:M23 family metallopeptidase [Deltaproteobacteria bacterium]HOI07175.1 M23 family metallopeptidase [Deltaproteobacteria bacterium]